MFLLLLIAAQCSLLLVASYCGSSLLIAAYYGLLRIIADFCRWVMAHCPDSENLKAEEYDLAHTHASLSHSPAQTLPPSRVAAIISESAGWPLAGALPEWFLLSAPGPGPEAAGRA